MEIGEACRKLRMQLERQVQHNNSAKIEPLTDGEEDRTSDGDSAEGSQRRDSDNVVEKEEVKSGAAVEMVEYTKDDLYTGVKVKQNSDDEVAPVRKSFSLHDSHSQGLAVSTMSKSHRSSSSQLMDFSRKIKDKLVESTSKLKVALQPGIDVLKEKAALVKESIHQVIDETKPRIGRIGGLTPINEKRRAIAPAPPDETSGVIITPITDTLNIEDILKDMNKQNSAYSSAPEINLKHEIKSADERDRKNSEPDSFIKRRTSLKEPKLPEPSPAPLLIGIPQADLDELAAMRAALLSDLILPALPLPTADLPKQQARPPQLRRRKPSKPVEYSAAEDQAAIVASANLSPATANLGADDLDMSSVYSSVTSPEKRKKPRKNRLAKLCGHLAACTCAKDKNESDGDGQKALAPFTPAPSTPASSSVLTPTQPSSNQPPTQPSSTKPGQPDTHTSPPAESSTKPTDETKDLYESTFKPNMPGLMTATRFFEVVSLHKANGITSQYFFLTNEKFADKFTIAKLKANAAKNRYSDVLCYDSTRVILDPIDDDSTTDFINASFVNGYQQKNAYIACQGPLQRTSGDFWRMVWQENVRVIVMTTRAVEKGRTKCYQYWPEIHMLGREFDLFMVVNVGLQTTEEHVIAKLNITHKETNETRVVYHLLFQLWPDYGVPSSAADFLDFLFAARTCQKLATDALGSAWKGHPRGPPMIVHCSAGVGRSGTFICADICIYMLDDMGKVNVQGTVRGIRQQRAYAVQTGEQYVFCHSVILEYAQRQGLIPKDIDLIKLLAAEE